MGSVDASPKGERRRRAWGLVAALALVVGCGPEPDYPPLVEQAWPFRFYAERPLPLCAMDLAQAHYARWSELLGISLDPDEHIDVLVHDPEYVSDFCSAVGPSGQAVACAQGRVVVVPYAFHPHELTHAYASELRETVSLLEEGLAGLGACGGLASTAEPALPLDPRAMMRSRDFWELIEDDPDLGRLVYDVAESFVAHVVRELGWPTFVALRQAIGRDASWRTIDRAFRAHAGASFATWVLDWESAGPLSEAERCALVVEAPEPLPLDVEVPAECVFPVDGGGPRASLRGSYAELGFSGTASLDAPSRMSLSLRGGHGVRLRLTGDALPAGLLFLLEAASPDGVFLWDAPAGAYRIDAWEAAYLPRDASDFLTYTFGQAPLAADRCALAPVDAAARPHLTHFELEAAPLAGDGIDLVIPVTVDAPVDVVVEAFPAEAPAWWCVDQCAAGPPCQPVPYVAGRWASALATTLQPGATYRLVVSRPAEGQVLAAAITATSAAPP